MNPGRYWEDQDNQFDDAKDQLGRSLLPLDLAYASIPDDRGSLFFITGVVTSRRPEGFPESIVLIPNTFIQAIFQSKYLRVRGAQCMRVPTEAKIRTLIDLALRNENVEMGTFHYNDHRIKGIFLL